ncbi:filamentous hemagglutinin family protein [Luteolibacter flavescens]|uniref:Filamentous hemagglutinin family protein n=1 Tax=Luteolibacter flavescens TaxID=1859460 RepID=A0ABT3FN00_9BACT|nr:filamentous haemagglutinin family protein [Luteolibacter flavescens]MCW1884952.1 filamentous hemagglutinin family protein [Luteolibacter flavescens]
MSPVRHPRLLRRTSQAAGTALLLLGEIGLLATPAMAGDILRGGRAGGGAPQGAANPVGTTPPPIVPSGGTTRDSLARTAMAIQSVQAMQLAARNLANNGGNHANTNPNGTGAILPDVPDGLTPGGLQVDPRVTGPGSPHWTGANLPVQTTTSGGTAQVTVKQTAQQALLNWQTFNVGKNTTLTFDQSAGGANVGQWTAFNFINDPLANPTQILGKIEAPGQVYIMNRNGIVFGGSSQVNVRGLTVSSLPINTNLIANGLLNNPDSQFLFSGLAIPAGANGTPAFTPEAPHPDLGRYGDVVVEAGAILNSPTDAAKVGGRITLVGPNVTNRGSILTPDGQAILAAGMQVGFAAHDTNDPSLRGLDVFIGQASGYAGTATNDGLIEAMRGSIVMAGRAIAQNGALTSTTSVALNGRIDLLAHYNAVANTAYNPTNTTTGRPFIYQDSGTVSLGEGSLISILPELTSKDTTVGTQLALRSQVNIAGRSVYLGEDSLMYAPNAKVSIQAGEWVRFGTNPQPSFVQSTGQVYLDKNAQIDVSGTDGVEVGVAQNILSIQLRGAELANSPLQREGPLRNATVNVDIRDAGVFQSEMWVGTPLADISGFANLIQRGVGQLTVAGGSVDIGAGGSFVMQSGSGIDVSGGSTIFKGGVVKTTRLVTADGSLVDIADARPDETYLGIYDGLTAEVNRKWSVSNLYKNPLGPSGERYEADSVQGGAGGSISIAAPSMALDGKFTGETVNGAYQRDTPAQAAKLSLSFTSQDKSYASLPLHAPTPPTVTFQSGVTQTAVAAFQVDAAGNAAPLSAERQENVYLSPELLAGDGFGSLTVYNPDGDIVVPENVSLVAPALGSISLTGTNVTVDGSIIAPGGSITFKSSNFTLDMLNQIAGGNVLPAPLADRGVFTLGEKAVISTAGMIVDDRPTTAGSPQGTRAVDGGSVSIDAYSTTLSTGGLIDVSGGAIMSERGRVTYGDGGSITVADGSDDSPVGTLQGGRLQLGATLKGYSGAKAGSLTLNASAFQVGGTSTTPGVIVLQPDFFNQGGFGSFSLTGLSMPDGAGGSIPGLSIAEGTVIAPVVQGLIASSPDSPVFSLSTVLQEEGVRTPVSLTFGAKGVSAAPVGLISRGGVVMGEGAVIRTDAQGTVVFNGQTVAIHGTVEAPAGSITINGANSLPSNSVPTSAAATTLIGSTARLSTAGTTVLTSNPLGLRQGKVLGGGSITVTGNIIAETGAVLDVSGTSGVLDLPPGYLSLSRAEQRAARGRDYVPVTRETNGGSITLSGAQMLYSDATLVANAGGKSATGGSLTVSSGRFITPGQAYTSADTNLIVTQTGPNLPAGNPGIGETLRDADGNVIAGIGNFAVDRFAAGGFDSLTLNGNVRFEGDVTIQTPGRLRVASGGVITATGNVVLDASHVALGQAFRPPAAAGEVITRFTSTDTSGTTTPYAFAPVHGTGDLTVKAQLIDVGDLSLQSIGHADFIATKGDIRGNGTLSAAGDLTFEAGQIYPTTGSAFNIFAYDHAGGKGSVTIRKGEQRALPYSAGGTLSIHASTIVQGGTLRAPIGTINLGWDGTGTAPVNPIAGTTVAAPVTTHVTLSSGSVTSVSAIDPVTGKGVILPYGLSLDGNSWIDLAGNNITVGGVPSKEINLAGLDVTSEAGSVIDMRGGGNLYAYRWISGNGGRKDVLDNSGAFAVIPGYGFDYAPYAANSSTSTVGGDPGYVNAGLRVGDQITLGASSGLPAGTYTLLPARYALLPGAFLVTPGSGTPAGTVKRPDGSAIVSGYRANNLDPSRTGATVISNFEVASAKVVRARSEYQDLYANTTLREAAIAREFAVPRLPVDAGYLSFTATTGMRLGGTVTSTAPQGGRGGVVDINSPVDIFINATGTGGPEGSLTLSSTLLNSFGAESILIGGIRTFGTDGATVSVGTGNLTVDNAGSALTGSDIILVAKNDLTLKDGSLVTSTGSVNTDDLILGNAAVAGSGDGTLVRVSGDTTTGLTRRGVTSATNARLQVGAGSILTGGSITLDSTYATSFDGTARLNGTSVSLNSGRISLLLDGAGTLDPANYGLVLSGQALAALQSTAKSLSMTSYSSLDVYGTGTVGSRAFEQLSLQASSIRGFNQNGGTATFTASHLILGNAGDRAAGAAPAGPLGGTLAFDARQITLGANDLRVDSFANVSLAADERLVVSGEGSFRTAGDLQVRTPLVTGLKAANHLIGSAGHLSVTRPPGSSAGANGGLGAKLTLEGGTLDVASNITLSSGELTLRSTAGNVNVGNARIDVGGTVTRFVDVTRYTGGGTVNLESKGGSVIVGQPAVISVAAVSGGGNAGTLNVSAADGSLVLDGTIDASAGSTGLKGRFTLDAGSLPGESLATLDATLNKGGFTRSRDYRFRNGDVLIDGLATSGTYRVATDNGSITVTAAGEIDASGKTGGTIDLKAHRSLILEDGASLSVAAREFDSAGKGGSIVLEAGAHRNGVIDTTALLDLRTGAVLDLGVAAQTADSAKQGKYAGTLHLRAPRNAANTDLQVAAIGSTINGASSILVEGYKVYDLTGTPNGTITSGVQGQILADGNAFLGSTGNTGANYTAMMNRLTGGNAALDLILAPGAEIINRTGNLTLGSTGSTASEDWNLSTFRFGPRGAAGVLTLRAAGDLKFHNALSDGFSGGTSLWLSPLNAYNAALPANSQTWSYRLTAGADFSAASFREAIDGTGSLDLGKAIGSASATGGSNATTASIIGNAFQVIRTGSGNIDITTGDAVRLLNPFASIYTAGTRLANANSIFAESDFVTPILTGNNSNGSLGATQQTYAASYSMAGGNVTITAGGNIERKTNNNSGLIDDSSRQLPNNWLYRRGLVGADGTYGSVRVSTGLGGATDAAASTTWWVDFSNFFQSVGALGGGNVTMTAGNDITNVDAVIPTNARTPRGTPDATKLVELGGGDLTVTAGGDISGGVYYVERGRGILDAGGSITTNATRSLSLGLLGNLNNPAAARLSDLAWMPTTLFLGKGSFDITARGDVLLGPVANPFLLPQGMNNRFWYKTHFSTYAADSSVTALSLGGDVDWRSSVALTRDGDTSFLRAWTETQQMLGGSGSAANFQPWLRVVETSAVPYDSVFSLAAPTLSLTALSGDVNLGGSITLSPASRGQLEIVASGAVNALQALGRSSQAGFEQRVWSTARINVSDADPSAIASAIRPLGRPTPSNATNATSLDAINALFNESGSYTGIYGVTQTKQALHTAGLLHAGDAEPVRIYAGGGDISGLTLFSPKATRVVAANDITDVSFYIQNLRGSDVSLVSAGRDIIAYNASSPFRVEATTGSNTMVSNTTPLAGDIQIAGPGTLEVLAGRNLDLGIGPGNADGTGAGVTSIGNLRNPYLTNDGADLVLGAGIGAAVGLAESDLNFANFITTYVKGPKGADYLKEVAPGVNFDEQPPEEQARIALEVFYLVMRDTGRDFNNPESEGYRNYDSGMAAIKALFGEEAGAWDGDILARARDIRTRSGGSISIFAPGGGLSLSNTTIGNPLAPPGVVTESGGDISIFTHESVDIGIGRIFTLRGGNAVIWSTTGDIAAGSSSRTVQAAPPTRVIVDPQSASVQTDLAGLATGGGIGVLATVAGVEPGDVDLIAPAGIIDAGDAGIRVSGNINLAAVTVVNAGNISAGGNTAGAPAAPSAPSISATTNASNNAAAASQGAEAKPADRTEETPVEEVESPSVITVEVLGYGGGSGDEEEDEEDDEEGEEEEGA